MREGDIFVWRNVVVSRVSDVSTTIKMDARIKSAHSALPTWDCRVWWPEHASLSQWRVTPGYPAPRYLSRRDHSGAQLKISENWYRWLRCELFIESISSETCVEWPHAHAICSVKALNARYHRSIKLPALQAHRNKEHKNVRVSNGFATLVAAVGFLSRRIDVELFNTGIYYPACVFTSG